MAFVTQNEANAFYFPGRYGIFWAEMSRIGSVGPGGSRQRMSERMAGGGSLYLGWRMAVFAGILLIALCHSGGLVQAQEVVVYDYQDPDYELMLFNEDAISLQGSDRALVVEALAALASNFHHKLVDMDLREKALALALRLDSLNPSARSARRSLMNKRSPSPTDFFQNINSLTQALWRGAEQMRKQEQGAEPEDKILIPLLMEVALVADKSVKRDEYAAYAASVEELGDNWPVWDKIVKLDKDAPSTLKAEQILKDGLERKKEIEEQKARAAAAAAMQSANDLAVNRMRSGNRPVRIMQGPGPDGPGAAGPGNGGPRPPAQIARPRAEANVIVWWRLGRRNVPMRLGKVSLDVRDFEPEDRQRLATLFDDFDQRMPLDRLSMVLLPPRGMEQFSSWVGYTANIGRERYDSLPRGKVGILSFQLLDGQQSPANDFRYLGGRVSGAVLALDSVLSGVEIDAKAVVYASAFANQGIGEAYGNPAEAVELARSGGFNMIVVPREIEQIARDWIILGDIDRLIHPQIITASNIEEMVQAMRIDRPAEVIEAIDLFSEIREIKSMTLEEAMKNAKVVERLQIIADQFPQHLSARMLLAYGKGVDGVKASLSGSLREITAVMAPFLEQYRTAMVDDTSAKEFKDMSDQAVERLSYLKDRVNGEAQGLHGVSEEALGALISYLRLNSKTSTTAMKRREDVEEALVGFNDEFRRLRNVLEMQERQNR